MNTRAGVIGVGKMGKPILKHLLRAGFTAAFYDINPNARVSGASKAASLEALADASDVVLIVVGTDEQVESCFKGKDNLLKGSPKNKIFVIISTVDPATLNRVAGLVKQASAKLLDAPVVWGEAGAKSGKLVSYVGGDRSAFKRCKRIFNTYSKGVFFLGPLGSGTVAKTANNHLMWICRFANLEALHLASRYFDGDLRELYRALLAGTCSNRCLERLSAGGGGVPWAKKDLKIIGELAKRTGLRADFARLASRAAVREDMLEFNRMGLKWLQG